MPTKNELTVAVVGASGYAGGELCRLLLNHPAVGRILPTARSTDEFEHVHPNLLGCGLSFVTLDHVREHARELDVVFFCTPSGEAMRHAQWFLEQGCRVIDLSADFRFADPAVFADVYGFEHAVPDLLPDSVYGVTELDREAVAGSRMVANPGCYAITATLALTPVLRSGLVDPEVPIHISAVNGTTGAGNKPKRQIMHAEAVNSMLPYSMEGHRHGPELEVNLSRTAGREVVVDFNTAHGNFSRGIYLQANLAVLPSRRAEVSRERVLDVLTDFYGTGSDGSFFVRVNNSPKSGKINDKEYDVYPSLAGVIGSNFCHIGADVDERRGIVKLIAVTDNLVKGAAGSAIQNMNVMLGLDETTALRNYGIH